ncbi:pseudaminic acid synthase [Gemmatimonadota bacterium]
MNEVKIGEHLIGTDHPTLLIAELSGNHNHDFDLAVEMIRAAARAGADAIKLQTYRPETITIDCDNDHFRIGEGTVWAGKTLFELYGEAFTPWEWQPKLKEVANEEGLVLFSTPFDPTAVDFLEEMEVPCYKIASFEIVDTPLIRKVAATGKPMIISTGMATIEEIDEAVTAARQSGCDQICLLKCTSAYPATPEMMNLRAIPDLSERFGVITGLSDHTLNLEVPLAAVALGARIIEKHFTLDRAAGGPDSTFSLEPDEFRDMVDSVRLVEQALGSVTYGAGRDEDASRIFRRSLFVVEDVAEGELFTGGNVRSIRPGIGLHPRHLEEILGRRASHSLSRGTPLSWDHVV